MQDIQVLICTYLLRLMLGLFHTGNLTSLSFLTTSSNKEVLKHLKLQSNIKLKAGFLGGGNRYLHSKSRARENTITGPPLKENQEIQFNLSIFLKKLLTPQFRCYTFIGIFRFPQHVLTNGLNLSNQTHGGGG